MNFIKVFKYYLVLG